jgi:hypothetical protein
MASRSARCKKLFFFLGSETDINQGRLYISKGCRVQGEGCRVKGAG